MADTYPRSAIPEPYETMVRRELRRIPTWKLQEVYGKLKAGEPTGIELVERNRAYAISAIEEVLWERGKLPTKGSHSSGVALPIVGVGIGTLSLVIGSMALLLSRASAQRVYSEDGQYLVSVRYLGQWHQLTDFVQPNNPDVVALYSEIGPDAWALYDWVARNISYRLDIGEFFLFPSEALARRQGDCEDTSILLTSLLRNFTDAYVALGTLRGLGHAWVAYGRDILETTYTSTRPVPDPKNYVAFVLFDEREVIELWPGALDEVFNLGRNEELKLKLMAKALEAVG